MSEAKQGADAGTATVRRTHVFSIPVFLQFEIEADTVEQALEEAICCADRAVGGSLVDADAQFPSYAGLVDVPGASVSYEGSDECAPDHD